MMKFFLSLLFFGCFGLHALNITKEDAFIIADKIWHNEGARKKESLTFWNKNEPFASLGIGHFIWFPTHEKMPFEQTFPSLIAYLKCQHIKLPRWLENASLCPWKTREDFYTAINSSKMEELRELLYATRNLQALFMAQRLEQTLPKLLAKTPENRKVDIKIIFDCLANQPRGLYALLDYLNFKGDGTLPSETYQGQSWGLLSVLLALSPSSTCLVEDFVKEAKQILTQRVEKAPLEKGEQRWLKGWFNRLDTY